MKSLVVQDYLFMSFVLFSDHWFYLVILHYCNAIH